MDVGGGRGTGNFVKRKLDKKAVFGHFLENFRYWPLQNYFNLTALG